MRYLILFLFIYFSFFFQFCNGCKCGPTYKIENYIYRYAFKESINGITQTLADDSIAISQNDTVYFSLDVNRRLVNSCRSESNGALYACCAADVNIYSAGDSMRIIALDSFDASHPAGSDVSNYFFIRPVYSWHKALELKQFSEVNRENYESLVIGLKVMPTNNNIRFGFYFYYKKLTDGVNSKTPILRFM